MGIRPLLFISLPEVPLMNKRIHPNSLPLLTLAAGTIGMALRFWLLSRLGEDMLLPRYHIAAILTAILTVAVIVCLFIFTQPLKGQGKYRKNFPASLPGAICCFAAALALFIRGMGILMDPVTKIATIAGIACILAVPCMVLSGMNRWKGQRTVFLFHGVCSACFAFLLMHHYQSWTSSPNLHLHLGRMVATAGLMLCFYHRAEFDVRIGSRRGYAFLNLATLYFCLLAVPEDDALFFLIMAAWLLTNRCSLNIFRQRPAALQPEEPVEPAEPAPAESAEPTPAESGQEEV